MPNVILSVYDKTGLVELADGLRKLGWRLIASGGTARHLRAHGLPVTDAADYTGAPEILGGRVKTLHPAIHGGLLARPTADDQGELQALGLAPIDLAVVNLYPFEATVARPGVSEAEALEQIDIGGVALMRAAAKNFARVTLLCDPVDYEWALAELRAGGPSVEQRQALALKGFAHTAQYDAAIAAWLAPDRPETLLVYPAQQLRYGENPHQEATLFAWQPGGGPLGGALLQGKPLSYNNLLDLDAAWRAVVSFERPTVVIVKHLSPCGIASGDSLAAAFGPALASDPVSAFGGVIAVNRTFDETIAAALGELFVECIVAPEFSAAAQSQLVHRKNLRLVAAQPGAPAGFEWRSIVGGLLRQSLDAGDPPDTTWRVVSQRQPSAEEREALAFAWRACQHVKSNAIVFARGEATVGIGGGQPNRVDCVRIAAARAGERARGAVMASDAFFPFPDAVEAAAEAGVTAIIQPGGSVRDDQATAAADAHGLAMVVTGVRHFRH